MCTIHKGSAVHCENLHIHYLLNRLGALQTVLEHCSSVSHMQCSNLRLVQHNG